jgi:hypothetical protein
MFRNRGYIDPEKWDIDDSSATITIDNGKARFDHDLNKPDDSSWLIFKKYPERIRAVMVTIRVAEPGGDEADLAGRVAGWVGRDSDGNYLFNQLRVRNSYERIDCWAGALETTSSQDFVYEAFFAFFERPIPIVNKNYAVTMYFSPYELKFSASKLGTISHKLPKSLYKSDDFFKGIGTRSFTATTGTGVVYFDNVYVMY